MLSHQLAEELVGPLLERGPDSVGGGSEINTSWIKGIRKSWKAVSDKAKGPPGVIEKAAKIDFDLLPKAAKIRIPPLNELLSYVKALRSDLLVNKNMWSTVSVKDAKASKSKLQLLRARVVEGLDKAEDAIAEALHRIDYWVNVSCDTSSHDYKLSGGSYRSDAEGSLESFQRLLNSINGAALEGAVNADAEISRGVLQFLSRAIMKIKDQGRVHEYPVDLGSSLPEVVQVGKVTMVFSDGPASTESHVRPRARFRKDYMGGSVKAEPRSPRLREKYLKELQAAEALLRRRGLQHLWYGRIVIMCKECGGTNRQGAAFGVGAHYHRKGDWVSIYSDPWRGLSTLVAHELGHRYYYKFMSASDRARFDRWFGTVKAVSAYGGTATEEDFAEVFSWYIDGKNLDRDQLDRLKALLGKKRRLEHVSRRARTFFAG